MNDNKKQVPSTIFFGEEIPDQIWLALDTSTSQLTTAVVRGKEVLGMMEESAKQNHSIKLVPNIERLIKQLGLEITQIQGIAAGYGPGSYTGVRIGVTVAKTLAWSLNIPLLGISSIEALAYRAGVKGEVVKKVGRTWIIPLINGRRGRAYTGLYSIQQDSWIPLLPDGIRPVAEWLEQISYRVNHQVVNDEYNVLEKVELPDKIIITGEVEGFKDDITTCLEQVSIACEVFPSTISAVDIAELAGWRIHQVKSGEDVHEFVPNYTQLAEAEAKLKAKRSFAD